MGESHLIALGNLVRLGLPLQKGGYKLPRSKLGNSILLLPVVPGTQNTDSASSQSPSLGGRGFSCQGLLWIGVLPGALFRALYLLGSLPHKSPTPVGTCILPTLCML